MTIAPQSPLKVLFLTRYPIEGASSRYRVFQYLPHLAALGLQCSVQSFMDARMYRLSQLHGRTGAKMLSTLRATLARLGVLWQWRRYDVIYLQRELLPFGPPVVERWLVRRGAVLVFDYDDALFIKKASRFNPIATLLRSPDKTRELFRLAACTVAGNDWLRDAARANGGVSCTIEVAEDTGRIPAHRPHDNDRPVTIGWLGSPSTVKYLRLIEAALRRIAARHPTLKWEIMGGGDLVMPGIDWHCSDWSLASELDALARFDIGLMPLPSEDWARGKSGGKARTYMAAGVVPVVAAIGYNLELVRHDQTGMLCHTDADWDQHIERLILDPALRQRLAVAARAEVEKRFSPLGQATLLARLLRSTHAARRGQA